MKTMRILGAVVLVLMLAGLVLGAACAGEKGEQGDAGVGIQSITNNGDGTFTIKMTDGSSFTTPNLTGPRGPKGDKGDKGDPGPSILGTSYLVGGGAGPICYDGANIWVGCRGFDGSTGSVVKVRASDGALLERFTVGRKPTAMCFDGSAIWVTIWNTNTAVKLRPSDGAVLATVTVGTGPQDICFDGENIWVAAWGSPVVTKVRAADGQVLGSYDVGEGEAHGIVFDGSNIWLSHHGEEGKLTKLSAVDGTVLGTFTTGDSLGRMCYDGQNIWAVAIWDNRVLKIRPSDGAVIGRSYVGINGCGGIEILEKVTTSCIYFDGASVWVNSTLGNTVYQLDVNSGACVRMLRTVGGPIWICHDGTSIWVAEFFAGTVTKFNI